MNRIAADCFSALSVSQSPDRGSAAGDIDAMSPESKEGATADRIESATVVADYQVWQSIASTYKMERLLPVPSAIKRASA